MFYQFYRLGPDLDASWPHSGGSVVVRISENARKCVVFSGIGGAGPMDNAGIPLNISYGGTGFLVAYKENGVNVPYLVTCKHVAKLLSKHSEFYIRANTRGGAYTLSVKKIEWAYHPDETVDLAAASYALQPHIYDVIYFRLDAGSTVLGTKARSQVFCGEPISLIGLFRLHSGKQRNISFVHTGNIAVLPDEDERIPMRDRTTNEAVHAEVYLVEAQTLDGLSGSPAFVHEIADLPDIDDFGSPPRETIKGFGSVRLLGLYTGSWDGEPGKILAEDRDLRGHGIRVPVGVGTVVPADRILELIKDDPTMKQKRKDYVTAQKADPWAAVQDAAIPDPAVGDANPKHREDFNSLLDVAVKKPAREG